MGKHFRRYVKIYLSASIKFTPKVKAPANRCFRIRLLYKQKRQKTKTVTSLLDSGLSEFVTSGVCRLYAYYFLLYLNSHMLLYRSI